MTTDNQKTNSNLPKDLHQAGLRWAKENESSLAGLIRLAVKEFLDRREYLTKQRKNN